MYNLEIITNSDLREGVNLLEILQTVRIQKHNR